MAFAHRNLTEGQLLRRQRLIHVLPEVARDLEERRKDPNLTGKDIKEIDLALRGVNRSLACLKAHESTHDCNLATVVGSTAIGKMHAAIFGRKELSAFLGREYSLSEEAFRMNGMEVPLVLREIYKKYKRLETSIDDQIRSPLGPHVPFDC